MRSKTLITPSLLIFPVTAIGVARTEILNTPKTWFLFEQYHLLDSGKITHLQLVEVNVAANLLTILISPIPIK
jgi:hypothetical protein